MAIVLLIAFIATPIVEIAVFIEIGGLIGLWPTLAVVVATAFAGTWLLRMQGIATLQKAQESLARQEFPMQQVFDGLCLLFAGALLLTPGFVTDAIGLALFVLPVRWFVQRMVRRWMVSAGRVEMFYGPSGPGPRNNNRGPEQPDHGEPDRGLVIEGKFEEVRPPNKNRDQAENGKRNK